MTLTEWHMQGTEFTNCNCDWGCPCQFNGSPSRGHCRALSFVQIERGHFDNVELDGLRWGILAAWPGPIHHGDGTLQAIIDQRADAKQQAALEAIAHGRETEPGTLIWQVFSTTVTRFLPTLVKPIELRIDVDQRTATLYVPGVIDGEAEPIRNRVTGAAHRVRVVLPAGFEFTEAEFASGRSSATGAIEMDFSATHAHLARVNWSTHGIVR